MSDTVNCPDCQKSYPHPGPGSYRCAQCLCKFRVNPDRSMAIIPYFEEIHLEPIIVMLAVLGVVLVFAAGEHVGSFSDRLSLFGIIALAVFILYKGTDLLCRRYRGVDRFFRRFTRPPYVSDPEALIRLNEPE